MRQVYTDLDTFTGVGYGQTAKIVLETGPTINSIGLEATGIDNDQIEHVELLLNGDSIVNCRGDFFRTLEDFKINTQADGVWLIQFLQERFQTNEGQRSGELVTLDSDKLILKVKIGAATAQQGIDGTVPTLAGYTETTAGQKVRHWVPQILEDRIEIGATGLNRFKTFPRGARIVGMHIVSADVEEFKIKVNGFLEHESTPARNNRLLERADFAPQVGFYHFYPVMTGFGILDMFRTAVNKLEFQLSMAAAGDVDVIYQMIEWAGDASVDPLDTRLALAKG